MRHAETIVLLSLQPNIVKALRKIEQSAVDRPVIRV